MYIGSMSWENLKELVYEQMQKNEKVSWKELNKIMERMEFEEKIYRTTNFQISEEEKEAAIKLLIFEKENSSNCFDYIEYISKEDDEEIYRVGIFTEPLGIVGFKGKDLVELLTNIYELYSSQPKEMSYIDAGHILFNLQEKLGVPLDFNNKVVNIEDVWKTK